uniref:Phosphatidate cytidylyltransferase, mitochondrial n=1 Tax=Haemonchus contortus TaxID=6289 RepID=A0A7I4Y009_HAECO
MSTKEYEDLISVLPLSTVEYAFAYGSGALQQKGENKSEKMIDFVLCTSDPVSFHKENIKKNSSHYSLLRCIGANTLAQFQTRIAAHVYYNTHVHIGNRRIKYGVISTEDLNRDLLDWRWLYVAGRLHKPVLDVRPTAAIASNVEENRRCALQAALLLLPDSFDLEKLYQKIVSLSYTGDFRMYVGEDKDKIKKIVLGCMEYLSEVYDPLLASDSRLVVQNGSVLQDGSTAAIYHRLNLLPSTVLERIQTNWNKRNKWQKDREEVLFSLAHRHDVTLHVEGAISSIVAPAAISQTLKNAASAGFSRSVMYSLAKLAKMVKSIGK